MNCVLKLRLWVGLVVISGAVFSVSAEDVPKGLKPIKHPKDNLPTEAKISLGKQLFFDGRLSSDNKISCASCHDPAQGWSNGEAFATGVDGQKGGRSAPTVINAAYQQFHFWDGRAGSLEEQALGPIENPIEMNMQLDDVVKKLSAIQGYRQQFRDVFDSEVTAEGIGKAIAAYERTALSGNAPYDHFKAGDKSALSDAAERGRKLFFGKANCSACHSGPNFTDNGFHNIGVSWDVEKKDEGRFAISGLEGDTGSFKTPTLREIARTAPYMHDGSMATLEAVIDHYAKGGVKNPYLDEEVFLIKLEDKDKADLLAFMKEALSSDSYPNHTPPTLPK